MPIGGLAYCDSIDAAGLEWTFSGNDTPTYLVDTRLMFGASKSPEIFSRVPRAVVRMMERRGFTVVTYLDDFLVIADSYDACLLVHNTLIDLLQGLGFQINVEKLVLPCRKLSFLGIDVCTVTRTLSLNGAILMLSYSTGCVRNQPPKRIFRN